MIFVFQDNVLVTVVASIQYRAVAQNAADAFYKLSNTKAQIQAYVFDGTALFSHLLLSRLRVAKPIYFVVIRASVPRLILDAVLEQKNEIAKSVEQELEKVMLVPTVLFLHSVVFKLFACFLQAMSAYGFEIVQTLIVDIEPDRHVKKAMNEINAGKFATLMIRQRLCIGTTLSIYYSCVCVCVNKQLLG